MAFLSGDFILNVLKDELPGDRGIRFYAYLSGVAVYGALILDLQAA